MQDVCAYVQLFSC